MPRKTLRQLLEQIARTRLEELDCDQVYHLLDEFAERAASGGEVAVLLPLVQQHLELCRDCQEECEALLRALWAASCAAQGFFLLGDIPSQASALSRNIGQSSRSK